MSAILAALPILVILLLMLGRHWSAGRAGAAGVVTAAIIALAVFGFPHVLEPPLPLSHAAAGVLAEAAFTTVTILWIIGPALGIHQLQMRTGAAGVLRASLARIAPDPRILALLVAWFFVLFMEGAAGFGASVALAAPFLVGAGFGAVQAVTISLVGHAVGVSFGAIGTPIVPQVVATGIDGQTIARATGIYHSLLGWLPLAVMVAMVTRTTGGGRGVWGWALAAYLCFVVPYTLLWRFIGPELPTIGGALFGGGLFVLLLHLAGRRRQPQQPAGSRRAAATDGTGADAAADIAAAHAPQTVLRAAAPYLVLVVLVLSTRLVPPLRAALQAPVLEWLLYERFAGSIQLLYHPGSMLLGSFVLGAVLQGARWPDVRAAVAEATRRLAPVAVALVAMLVLSRLMVHAGMTEALAVEAANRIGGGWPLIAPFVGVLGTFVTGSATASNILFTDFQRETALAIGLPVAGVVGVQGFGAAVGNIICPHNVVAAGATVGLVHREGEILRRTLWVAALYTGLGGLLALWLIG